MPQKYLHFCGELQLCTIEAEHRFFAPALQLFYFLGKNENCERQPMYQAEVRKSIRGIFQFFNSDSSKRERAAPEIIHITTMWEKQSRDLITGQNVHRNVTRRWYFWRARLSLYRAAAATRTLMTPTRYGRACRSEKPGCRETMRQKWSEIGSTIDLK